MTTETPNAFVWQPIETAPKDGSWFLVWMPPNRFEPKGSYHLACWHHGNLYHPHFIDPTHWMPLPDGPFGDTAK